MASSHSYYFLHLTFFILVLGGDGANDYKDALEKSITFFKGQRSGKLPPPAKGQDITWRADSALKDGHEAGLDLTGGYYDAGDNEKFNFPMAFTTTMLSWSVIEFGKNMGDDESERAREAIRWATDYLLKSSSKVVSSKVLYVGVGNGGTDHNCWERPEDIDDDTQGGGAYRDVYSVSASNRGGDIAGETAAALAAASIVFRNIDRPYSRKLLATAKDVMQFAMAYRGGNKNNYYPSYSGDDEDEMLWSAAWLLRATRNDNKYLNYIRSLGANDDVDLFSWENKYAGAYVFLSRRFLAKNNSDPSAQDYSKKVETFMCKILSHSYSTTSSTQYTPGGLLYKNEGGSNLQYVTSITFLMTVYAKYMASMTHTFSCGSSPITSKVLRDLAKAQVDYILGDNPNKMSYMVGYGNRFPQRIHHRGSSIPSTKALPTKLGCHGGDSYRSTQNPNPNVLTGAIVGGPGGDDGFEDSRDNYAQSEPATYINAPFVGTLAYIAGRQK